MPLAGKVFLLWRCPRYRRPAGFLNTVDELFAGTADGYDPPLMALLIIFVGITTLTAAAIGATVAAGTTTGVVVALFLYLLGSVIVIGATLAALGPDGSD